MSFSFSQAEDVRIILKSKSFRMNENETFNAFLEATLLELQFHFHLLWILWRNKLKANMSLCSQNSRGISRHPSGIVVVLIENLTNRLFFLLSLYPFSPSTAHIVSACDSNRSTEGLHHAGAHPEANQPTQRGRKLQLWLRSGGRVFQNRNKIPER